MTTARSSPWPTYRPRHRIRLVTAGSLFDGHDAAINIVRRLLQAGGAEVIHLAHNRSVAEIVKAAAEEHVNGVCVSSYQGGHNEFFRFLVDGLREAGASHIKVFGGGGGTILPSEIEALEAYGVCRIYSPADGQKFGFSGIINDVLEKSDFDILDTLNPGRLDAAALLTLAEHRDSLPALLREAFEGRLSEARERGDKPLVVGVTGTGGAGKSSLIDELVCRIRRQFPEKKIGILCVDPSKKKTGGSLLADRIRMNSLDENVFLRSMAMRESRAELPRAIGPALDVMKGCDFDLLVLETAGIGQADSAMVSFCDVNIYVMTAEYGSLTQLEKIEMLDHADFVVVNKFERRGSEDTLRHVVRQVKRNRRLDPALDDKEVMAFGTIASRFNDGGVTALFENVVARIGEMDTARYWDLDHAPTSERHSRTTESTLPPDRQLYLSEIARCVENYCEEGRRAVETVTDLFGINRALKALGARAPDTPHEPLPVKERDSGAVRELKAAYRQAFERLHVYNRETFLSMVAHLDAFRGKVYTYRVRNRDVRQPLTTESLAGLEIPRLALPAAEDWPSLFRFVYFENLPGFFPYAGGVFPLRRPEEDPTRMFAGEGPPARTNARFHYVSKEQPAKRLSTAFDSLTLYGEIPTRRPDIYGKIGEGGVSVCTVEDMELLYAGFDLCDPATSVSMTINGPAPAILAFFMNTATRQACRRYLREQGRLDITEDEICRPEADGRTWEDTRALLSDREYAACKAKALRNVRGTVQADILKEEQAQNTCVFSLPFALRMMGDVQEYFVKHKVGNFYSVSISGYHIAEAGANPITQLAFTLANGFTYVEAYLARGIKIDDFAPNLSFFFSTGLDPEYTVIGRVARRIWAVAMRGLYGGDERSQKLKYHIQTSGRSLHAQEIDFNDIRTTLQALMAYHDTCNSLHTNAYNEAITTPTEESVRRALAIQLIIAREFGQGKSENILQGSHFIEWLTDRVEGAVLEEFHRLSDRGGVLGAIETQYQRSRIQEESLLYEARKNSGELPIMGVNTFLNPRGEGVMASDQPIELARCTAEEKESRLRDLEAFHRRHAEEAPAAIAAIQECAIEGGNLFETLMEAAPHLSLGQITEALYAVGGRYRRSL
ncbi:MAG: methylmalonyl-CoA mutase family protein [Dehalococcoidia bacterium]|nr:methylmalonyl-CoA mutase family protein [Dehalococcoidia bacterium]